MRSTVNAISSAPRRLLRALRARGFVLFVIGLLTALYAVGLVVPQRRAVTPATWEAWREQSPRLVRALEVTGLGDVYNAPGTYVALGFFFLTLGAVIVERLPRLLRRTSSEEGIPVDPQVIARRKGTLSIDVVEPEPSVRRAAEVLRDAGYRVHAVGPARVRAVRFRLAPLGFVLFHGAFALLLAGGVMLDLTRFSGVVEVGEGETFDASAGEYAERPREPRIGDRRPPELAFTVSEVRPRTERGHPLSLHVGLHFRGDSAVRVANINEPIDLGTTSILAVSAGPMPLFTCEAGGAEDGTWVKLVPNPTGRSEFLLEPCQLAVLARPAEPETAPAREEGPGVMRGSVGVSDLEDVARRGIEVAVRGPDGAIAHGVLRPGDSIGTPDGRGVLHMPELRRYAKLQIVDERGGTLLWAAFVLGTLGLVLRLVLFRREIVVVGDSSGGRVLIAFAADVVGWRPDALVRKATAGMRSTAEAGPRAPVA